MRTKNSSARVSRIWNYCYTLPLIGEGCDVYQELLTPLLFSKVRSLSRKNREQVLKMQAPSGQKVNSKQKPNP